MPIPAFDQHGLLPSGVWDCTLDEIQSVLAWNETRQRLYENLHKFLTAEWYPLNNGGPVYVDGSFVRGKPNPQDIDVVLDFSAIRGDEALARAILLRLRHDDIKAQYGVDVWSYHPDLPQNIVEFFQYLGTKAAADLRMSSQHRKGILRLI